MEKNKTGKYIKYAIGEIVLVIIGILIALQINNWNETRKSKLESKVLLELLNQDLRKDLIYFESSRAEYDGWLLQIENIINNVLDGKTKEITRLDEYAAGRSSMNYLHVNQITFIEMFNSGKNLKFDNQELVRSVKDYFQYAEIELMKLNSDNEYFFETLLTYYGEKGLNTWHRLNTQRNLEFIDWSWLNNPSSNEYMNLESILLYYKLAIEETVRVIQELEKRSKFLSIQISEELEL